MCQIACMWRLLQFVHRLTCVRGKTCPMSRLMLDIFAIQYDGVICDCWPIDDDILTTSCFLSGNSIKLTIICSNPSASRENSQNTRLKQALLLRMHNYMRAMDKCHIALPYTFNRLYSRTLTKPINYSAWCKAWVCISMYTQYLIQALPSNLITNNSFIFGVGFGWGTCLLQQGSNEETGLLVSRRFSAILKLPDFLHANLEDFQLSSCEDFLSLLFLSNLLIFPNVQESITLVILCLPHICVIPGNYTVHRRQSNIL